MLDSIPESLLGEVMDFLSLEDRLTIFMTCSGLWHQRISSHGLVRRVDVKNSRIMHSPIVHYWNNLRELNLGVLATDALLMALGNDPQLLPQLTALRVAGAKQISNVGLEALARAGSSSTTSTLLSTSLSRRSLSYIDITYCDNTTYAGTFCLRDAFEGIVIRRQPSWMDGQFVTPFDDDGLHTYWCDGSFWFERSQQSCGHVCSMHCWSDSENHVGDKLQYTNFIPPNGWPDWSRYCYRPGVSLLRLHDGSVLVGQRLYGLKPPPDYPTKDHEAVVPLHTSRYFDRQGHLLSDDASPDQRRVMVSRMKVLPLKQLMPPLHVVNTNRDFCARLDQGIPQGEEILHHALSRD